MNQHVKRHHGVSYFIFTEGAGTVSGRTTVVSGGRDGVGPGVEPRGGRLLVPALHRDVRRGRRTVGRQRWTRHHSLVTTDNQSHLLWVLLSSNS